MSDSLEDYTKAIRQKIDLPLSPHFRLSEMVATNHTDIHNWPADPLVIRNLKALCVNLLEPLQEHYGKPVKVSSGYRSLALNTAVGGAANSQHLTGEAADFEIDGFSNLTVCQWIETHLTFDQLILEFHKPGQPSSGWVHCSYSLSGNDRDVLTAVKSATGKTKYLPGLVA